MDYPLIHMASVKTISIAAIDRMTAIALPAVTIMCVSLYTTRTIMDL